MKLPVTAFILLGVTVLGPDAAGAQSAVPRTEHGRPDLQGNWTNATITPLVRPRGTPLILTPEQVRAIEGDRQEYVDEASAPSSADRDAPPVGGIVNEDPVINAASGGTGGYNYFYLERGDLVAVYNGEPRSSILTVPENGRVPALTPEALSARDVIRAERARFGAYDNPENRPLAERCIMSFGSNAGPPMLPNYFYNNNYTITQTENHVVIMTEMVHDTRIIQLGDRKPLPAHIRPWMGDSWGHWEGDTLVVETTNFHPEQLPRGAPHNDNLRVTERFTRADAETINYEFRVIDPTVYTEVWGGELPFKKMNELVYEYACHEANYALENVLRGARAQERGTNR